ncbi:MAG: 2-succinyl-5-enolpyruvyl-6-hydroxy-3-cyclohexene-1-carboxylic-acid synthase [Deltaproteobacteria bacterium]|nr:2-succinyl-5-enolpyruvyl-6-hydroxy-3-cyclohexene-1-carboxylic-acid synthase [Deltaproteobacteria bacterium]
MAAAQVQAQVVRALVHLLANLGVDHVVLSPGSRSTPLAQAVAEREECGDWRITVVLDERSAGFVALGLARAGHRPLLVCTSGSAVANWLPAVVEAGESGLPLLLLSGDRPLRLQGVGAPQTVRQQQLLASYAAVLHLEACAEDATSQFATVATKMRQHVAEMHFAPRPLHLNVGLDLPLALTPGPLWPRQAVDLPAAVLPAGPVIAPPEPDERVLVVAGPLTLQDPQLLQRLAQSALLLAEWPSHLAVGQLRWFDLWLRDPEWRRRALPDRLVRLGEWPASKGLQLLLDDAAAAGVPFEVVEPGRTSDPLGCNRLSTPLSPLVALRTWGQPASGAVEDWRAQFRALDRLVQEHQAPLAGPPERLLVRALTTALAPGDRLVLAKSMAIRDADAFCPCVPAGVTVHVARGANGIDGSLAAALGTALAGDRTWLLCGDGAFLHDCGSLQLLAQCRPDLRIAVVDNGGGTIFDLLPAAQALPAAVHDRLFYAPHGLDLLAITNGFGLTAQRFDEPEAAVAWLAAGASGPRLAVVAVDRASSLAARRATKQQVLAQLAGT